VEIVQKAKSCLDYAVGFLNEDRYHSVGVDIGSDSIKIVELEKSKNKIKLKNYALVKMRAGLDREDIRKFSGKIVKDILEKMSINYKKVNLAIPSYSSLINLIEISGKDDKEVEKEILENASKYIPVNLEDVIFDWIIIDSDQNAISNSTISSDERNKSNDEENKKIEKNPLNLSKKALLVSTMKNVSNQYEKSFEDNGLSINSIEVDCFSLQRALLEDDDKNYLIIDIGNKITNFIGVHKGQLLFNRNIDLAGSKLTELIAKSFNVKKDRAEMIKIKQGLKTDSKEILKNVLEPFCDSIINQADKILGEFDELKKDDISKVVLSGGGSEMVGFKEYLEERFKKDVVFGNPWKDIDYPEEIKDIILALSPFFGVAVGLALIDLEYILKK
jgi:type IV pilus assembly protein PilM